MNSRSEPDVIVVGGGPAGAATAARLALEGHQVVVYDRAQFPRPKPCGDTINSAGVGELTTLGVLEDVLSQPHTKLYGWRIHPARGEAFRGTFPTEARPLAMARERLDEVLLAHARACGVDVRLGERVVELLRGRGGEVLGVCLAGGRDRRARLVIGADGLRSVVLRRLKLISGPPRLRKLALTARVTGVEGLGGWGELYAGNPVTVGIAPIRGGVVNVVVVVSGEGGRAVAGGREAFFDAALARLPRTAAAARLAEVHATGPFDWRVRRATADGAMLVGDAAGYFDPFTGQGVYRALRGAALAAEVAHGALRSGDLSLRALATYDELRRQAFAPGERLQHLIEMVVSRERLFRLVAAGLRRRPAVADELVAVAGDLHPVRNLWAPATLARLVR